MATPLITLQNLVTPLTAPQIRAMMVKSLVILGVRADLWIAGGVASTILTVASQIGALASSTIATAISGFFLPLAAGGGLNLLAYYVYGVTPPTATFATGNVTLTNSGGGIYTNVPVGGYICFNPTTKQVYTNTQIFTLGALTSVSVSIQAQSQGSIGNAVPGSITGQTTNLLGVTCTNPAAVIGLDPPADAIVRQMCLNALGARSVRGPRTAYGFAVQTAINSVTGAPVNINRWAISESSHTGTVTTYVAAPSGAPDPNDVTGVVNNIEAVARPNAVTAVVVAASVLPDADNLTVYCIAPLGVTPTQISTAIGNTLIDFFETYPIGGIFASDDTSTFSGLFASGIAGEIGAAVASVGGKMISLQGANDYALAPQAVPGNDVTVNVRIVGVSN